jgi:enoyl-CoA hydratase/carnithine racemase
VTTLRLAGEGDLAYLVLDGRPRNELTFAAFDQLARLVEQVLPTLHVAGLVLSGAGRHFSTGSDIGELVREAGARGNESSPLWCETHAQSFRGLAGLPYPSVAAIRGLCFGSALELALCCTARVAASNALLALPEAQHGLLPGCGGTVRATELVGYGRAMELILSGEPVAADRALALGLVDRVVSRHDVLAEAGRIAYCIAGTGGGRR